MDNNLIDLITNENIKLNMKKFRCGAPLCDSHMTITEFENKLRDVTISCINSKNIELNDDLLYVKANRVGEMLVENKKNIGRILVE